MIILGLTGGIATGKTTTLKQLMRILRNAAYFDADACVHDLLQRDPRAHRFVQTSFPTAWVDGQVDRQHLGRAVFGDPLKLLELERFLHPLVRAREKAFLKSARRLRRRYAVMDIPLLFETGAQGMCDVVIATSCPAFLQRQRAMRRPHMSEAKLQKILARQLSDAERRHKADFMVCTGLGLGYSQRQLTRILRKTHAARNRPRHRNHRA